MNLRARFRLAGMLVVITSMLVAAIAAWVITTTQLSGSLDSALRESVATASSGGTMSKVVTSPITSDDCDALRKDVPAIVGAATSGAGAGTAVAIVDARGGSCILAQSGFVLPTRSPAVLSAAADAAGGSSGFANVSTRAGNVRVHAAPINSGDGGAAIIVARSTASIDAASRRLAIVLFVVVGIAALIAAEVGRRMARVALRPVESFAADVEKLVESGDVAGRVRDPGTADELSELARTFNALLQTIDEAARSRRRVISDSSHELRTPLTSMRANLEVLERGWEIVDADERRVMLGDAIRQSEELSAAVEDLVRLARSEERGAADLGQVSVADLVEHIAARFARLHPTHELRVDVRTWSLHGDMPLLVRALNNLLDNSVRWSGADGAIELRSAPGWIEVRDHGAGFDAADLPHVFERFYRADRSRTEPGSGLGLAIVRQVAELHGGRAVAGNAAGGGAAIRIELPPNGHSDSQEPHSDGSAAVQQGAR